MFIITFFQIIGSLINNWNVASRREQEQKEQHELGYRIEEESQLAEHWLVYQENENKLVVPVHFEWNGIVIFTDALKKWKKPAGLELSEFERIKVLNRLKKYGAIWGKVWLNDSHLQTSEELKEDLRNRGIEYEELEGGAIMYKTTVEEERNSKSSPFFK